MSVVNLFILLQGQGESDKSCVYEFGSPKLHCLRVPFFNKINLKPNVPLLCHKVSGISLVNWVLYLYVRVRVPYFVRPSFEFLLGRSFVMERRRKELYRGLEGENELL